MKKNIVVNVIMVLFQLAAFFMFSELLLHKPKSEIGRLKDENAHLRTEIEYVKVVENLPNVNTNIIESIRSEMFKHKKLSNTFGLAGDMYAFLVDDAGQFRVIHIDNIYVKGSNITKFEAGGFVFRSNQNAQLYVQDL